MDDRIGQQAIEPLQLMLAERVWIGAAPKPSAFRRLDACLVMPLDSLHELQTMLC